MSNTSSHPQATTPMNAHPVLALEAARCLAFERGDVAAAEALLADDLLYVHAPGMVNTKAELIDFLRHRFRYESVQRRQLVLRDGGQVVWITGLLKLRGTRVPGGELVTAVSFVTQVWSRDAGDWRMSLFQATRIDDSAWPDD